MGLTKHTEQSGSEKVDDVKDIKVLAVRGRKIILTTTSAIPTGGKLLTVSIKVTLPESE